MKNSDNVVVRFAPSPTGMLHCGAIKTALINFLIAKKFNGKFLLRIEDTDQKRFVAGAEKYIVDSLSWFGITFDDGVNKDGTAMYRQSEREYKSFIDKLISEGKAYYAFDTDEELDVMRKSLQKSGVKNANYNRISRERMRNSFTLAENEVKNLLASNTPYVVRFNVPSGVRVDFTDLVMGDVSVMSDNVDDKIILKSDGTPLYHSANVIDDHLQGVTHVIRGSEWLPSTAFHILMYDAFGWDKPEFAHLPVINGPDGTKLSKRKKYDFPIYALTTTYVNELGEAISIRGFKEEGFMPEAIINTLALTGWNDGTTKEFFTIDELINSFSIENVARHSANFDLDKLKYFNAHYMRNRDDLDTYRKWIDDGSRAVHYPDDKAIKINVIAKERCEFAKDLYGQVRYFFEPVVIPENHKLKHEVDFSTVMTLFLKYCYGGDVKFKWQAADISRAIEVAAVDTLGKTMSVVRPDLRFALCGAMPGPDLGLIMEILGPYESCKRIYAALPEVFQRTIDDLYDELMNK